jgi:hypothetical protein
VHEAGDTGLPLAKAEVAIAKERYRDGLNRFLADVDTAYWELAFAREDGRAGARPRRGNDAGVGPRRSAQ